MGILEFLNQIINLISEKGFYVICGFCITLCLMVIAQHLLIRRLSVAIRGQANASDKLAEKTKQLMAIIHHYGFITDDIDFDDISKKTRVSNN